LEIKLTMKLEIFFLNSKVTTEIEKNIKVNDLLKDLKIYFNAPDANFALFDSNQNQLNESDIISIKVDEKKISLYLIKSNIYKENPKVGNLSGNMSIRKMITKCTGAKKDLEVITTNNQNKGNPSNILNLIGQNNPNGEENNNPVNRLLNLMQILEGINSDIRIIDRDNNNNNEPIEADEKALKELQDMGFPEDRARQALINSRNNINRATEILLGEGGD